MPKRKPAPPPGYSTISTVLSTLENELRDKVKESNANKRNTESIWPVFQINWQRSRYVYDMYYTYHRIDRKTYDYCLKHQLADAALIAKWKKKGYERLCSTYVINPANYKFGTTSICRVPLQDRDERQKNAQDPTTGCLGCASGKGGRRNIFGNKYGQNLAAVQVARERRLEEAEERRKTLLKRKREEQRQQQQEHEKKTQRQQQHQQTEQTKKPPQKSMTAGEAAAAAIAERVAMEKAASEETDNDDDDDDDDDDEETDGGEEETDDEEDETDDDEDDYGPTPAAGIWAGSQKLQAESETLAYGGDEEEDGGEKKEAKGQPVQKKTRVT